MFRRIVESVIFLVSLFSFYDSFSQTWQKGKDLLPERIPQPVSPVLSVEKNYAAFVAGNAGAGFVYVLRNINNMWVRDTLLSTTGFADPIIELSLCDSTLVASLGNGTSVYDRSSDGWHLTKELPYINPPLQPDQVYSPVIHGSHIAVAESSGIVMYERVGGTWVQGVQLSFTGPASNPVIALSDQVMALSTSGAGSVTLYEWSGFSWILSTTLSGSGNPAGLFGNAIAIDNNVLYITEPGSGGIYEFQKLSGVWSLTSVIAIPEAVQQSVDVSTNKLITTSSAGVTTIFEKAAGVWTSSYKISKSTGASGIDGDMAMAVANPDSVIMLSRNESGIWANIENIHPLSLTGLLYGKLFSADGNFLVAGTANAKVITIYQRNGDDYLSTTKILATDANSIDLGMQGLVLRGNRLVFNEMTAVNFQVINVLRYYELGGNDWALKQTIPLATTDGRKITMDGDWLLIPTEFSINGPGRIDFYHYQNGVWTFTHSITGDADDETFGSSLSISGTMVAIGSPGTDNGMVHVYHYSGSQWILSQSLSAPVQTKNFGSGIALSADNLAIMSSGQIGTSSILSLYKLNGSQYGLKQTLTPQTPGYSYSYSISLRDQTVAVCSFGAGVLVELYQYTGSEWNYAAPFPWSAGLNDGYGQSLNLADNNTLFIAAPFSDFGGSSESGVIIPYLKKASGPFVAHTLKMQYAVVGKPFSFSAVSAFGDGGGGPLQFTATLDDNSAIPSWLTLSNAGIFSGTPGNADVGSVVFKCTATDGTSVSTRFTLKVAATDASPVIVEPMPDQVINQYDYQIYYFDKTFSDADQDTLAYTLSLVGKASLPDWMTFDIPRRGISAGPGAGTAGSYHLILTASDVFGAAVSDDFVMTVKDPNRPNSFPIFYDSIEQQNAVVSMAFKFSLPDSTFYDPDGDPLTYHAFSADTASLPSWLTFDGKFFQGTPPPGSAGKLEILITATDPSRYVRYGSFYISILNQSVDNKGPEVQTPIPEKTVLVDVSFSYVIPQNAFSDPNGDKLVYTITFADGSDLPAWLYFNQKKKTLSGFPPTDSEGDLQIKVTATDPYLASTSAVFTLAIATTINEVDGISENIDMSLYPNPAATQVIATGTWMSTISLVFRDSKGEIIKTIVTTAGSSVEISDLSAGVFIVSCRDQTSNVVVVKRLIIIR